MTASFWSAALMWVPAIEVGDHLVSVVPRMDAVVPPVGPAHTLMWLLLAILILAPMGLPSALLCRWLWRLGYRRTAWSASIVVFAATAAIISSDGELIHSLQWIISASAFAPNILAMTLPVWIVVYPAIVGGLVWIAIAMLPRPEATHAETARRNSLSVGFWLLALLWLPAVASGAILIQFLPALVGVVPTGEVQLWVWLLPMFAVTLFVFSPAGLMIALPCRHLWRLGYRRAAWTVGVVAALSTAALVTPAMDLFLTITPPRFVGTTGMVVESLYYAGQMLPADIAMYLAVFNLPLLVVVVLLGHRRTTCNGRSGI